MRAMWMMFMLAMIWVGGGIAGAQDGGNDSAQFLKDVEALTAAPHRLAGTPEGKAAGDYIKKRLEEMGVGEVYELEMPLKYAHTVRCDVTVDGVRHALLPVRPNVIVPVATGPEGLTGAMIYVGRGTLAEYGDRGAEGKIVVMEYDCGDEWRRAFEMGAKAVIFLGSESATTVAVKQVGVPVNLVRLYAGPEVQKEIDLRKDYTEATVVSHVQWVDSKGRDLLVYLPGHQPLVNPAMGKPEMIVLSANYDTYGQVFEMNPGARGAANVAALLEATAYLKENRPRRDMLIAFLDDQGQQRLGARQLYNCIAIRPDDLQLEKARAEALLAEREYVTRAAKILAARAHDLGEVREVQGMAEGEKQRNEADAWGALLKALKLQADYIRDDASRLLYEWRMQHMMTGEAENGEEEKIKSTISAWDDVRRAMADAVTTGRVADVDEEKFNVLCERLGGRYAIRLRELALLIRINEQRAALRSIMRLGTDQERYISLHVAYNYSDGWDHWGVRAGDATHDYSIGIETSSDAPGNYYRVLSGLRQTAALMDGLDHLDFQTLSEPQDGVNFVQGELVSDGIAAGIYGIYNVSFTTGHDSRKRDGHPADTLDNLDWRRIAAQAAEGTRLIAAAADHEAMSVARQFNYIAEDRPESWDPSKYEGTGNFAALQISGGLKEDRPAVGALMAYWPGDATKIRDFEAYHPDENLLNFDLFTTEPVDANGRYGILGVSEKRITQNNFLCMPMLFDEYGRVIATCTRKTFDTDATLGQARVDVVPMTGFLVPFPMMGKTVEADPTQILQAVSSVLFNEARTMYGEGHGYAYLYVNALRASSEEGVLVKVYGPKGPVVLNGTPRYPDGVGMSSKDLVTALPIDKVTAGDLWQLNEGRLQIMRSRSISDATMEAVRGRASQSLEAARNAETVEEEIAAYGDSAQRSRHIHDPLRSSMNDLVTAIVMLLMLAIPLSYSLERLVFCFAGVYARVGGFVFFFVVTFGLLFWLHPGFSIASAPLVILLAFIIILLSSLVIIIVARKFDTELQRLQGQMGKVHEAGVSQMGTLLAAVNMGMSTMRRRPLRTALTALTVLALTFTILCFASIGSHLGVEHRYLGSASEGQIANIFIRQIDYTDLPEGSDLLVRGREGKGGLVVTHWQMIREALGDRPFGLAAADGDQWTTVEAILGIEGKELERWEAFTAALEVKDAAEAEKWLENRGVFLPIFTRDLLGVKVGDRLKLNGVDAVFAGYFDPDAVQALKYLDGQTILPADFQDPEMAKHVIRQVDEKSDSTVQRNYRRLSANQVVIASAALVQEMGGKLHVIRAYTGTDVDATQLGEDIAEVLPAPVWANGRGGVERMFFLPTTQVKGSLALVIPLVLGGLIIFGTLLGSITDREKEIYTLSALGLGPGHVGALFFAEATVYAVIGGMGGQVLAQGVSKLAMWMASHHWIAPPSLNFSSTNAIFAMFVVMVVVMLSAVYPAMRASKSANPGLARTWKMPSPKGDDWHMVFPFTVSSYDITGVVSFLAEHFRGHDDAGRGRFATLSAHIERDEGSGQLSLHAEMALAPFDLGVTQRFKLTARESEIAGVDEVVLDTVRQSGSWGDWQRTNRVFVRDLRKQFLLWRTLSSTMVERYRMQTLEEVSARAGGNGSGRGEVMA